MAERIATYRTRARGIPRSAHEIEGPDGRLGVLSIERNAAGMIVRGRFQPEKGEVLSIRREPGILRSQYSLWTEGREWLGSSLRPGFVKREIALSTGSKSFRLLPTANFGRGWRMLAPKTGEMARIVPEGFGRSRIEVFRKVDTELLIFAYFLAAQVAQESWWPARADEGESETIPTASKA
ncbi:MAG: hypothetical protein IPJ19_19210 [Planctomycetes bacterium]|nr:hypothetical protein [Planctomycetota bacterium]